MMVVLKFGGTSVASAENIVKVKDIIAEKLSVDNKIAVVVSAFGGVTDILVEIGKRASEGDESYQELLSQLEKRHIDTCKALFHYSAQSSILSTVKTYLNRIDDICKGIFWIRELTHKTNDYLLSFGEILSSRIIYEYLKSLDYTITYADPVDFIKSDSTFGNAKVDFRTTYDNIRTYFKSAADLSICPGFIASNEKNEITTLGRGGSDYTASLLAAGLQADSLEIWTDVDGMMTADPNFVSSAQTIRTISYEDAMELSHFGARVIYPPTIQPVFDENIPIYIKNTFNPSSPGTKISRHDENNGSLIKGLSCIQKIALINLKGSGMVGIPNISNRLFKALSLEKINVIMITQASSEHSICVGIDEQSVTASKRAIENEFAFEINIRKIDPLEIETGLSIIALVGSNMRHQIGVSGKMFSTLGENGINIKAIAQGSSERNISVIIDSPNVRKALSSLHESFFLSETKRINLFVIGVGNVGGAFLEQIKNQKNYLYKKHHLDIRVIAIANTTKMLINGSGLDLNHWKKNLTSSNSTFSLDDFVGEMVQMNLRNSVFIDNTDSAQIASVYEQVLSSNISVVTPNKVACSSGYENYIQLKSVALKSKSKFLFETNVGAGLPIISTINDLVKSGDVIHKIEAVLSGSLNFIFNNYSRDIPFKEVVLRAMKEGYTEPDPRIDLSGIDVRRKILILVRECGYQFNIDDVASIPFIPKHIMEADSIDGFVENLGKSEEEFLKLLDEAEKNDTRIKYVAMFSEGKASAGIQFIHKHHPFYQLEGKDNIILLYTERYKDQPLVVKGAGAGAEVTASGIFADVMRFANR